LGNPCFQFGHCRSRRRAQEGIEIIQPVQGMAEAKEISERHFARPLESAKRGQRNAGVPRERFLFHSQREPRLAQPSGKQLLEFGGSVKARKMHDVEVIIQCKLCCRNGINRSNVVIYLVEWAQIGKEINVGAALADATCDS
jgi:hypothetical protein